MSASVVVVEMVDGGLNNTKDRSLMRPGELSRCRNCYYRPHDPALYKHAGRVKYNTDAAATGTMIGLSYIEFDNEIQKLVRYRSSSATVGKLAMTTLAPPGETGTFTEYSQDIGVGPYLDPVYSSKRHLLLTGAATGSGALVGPNLVTFPSGSARRHGLAPVVSPPVVALVAGSWPNTTEYPLGWYFFITTEATAEDDAADYYLESSWEGTTMAAINVTSAGNSVQVTFPALVNTGTYTDTGLLIQTRRVYMAGPIGETDPVQTGQPPSPPLSMFRLVAEVPVAQLSTVVGATSLAGAAVPTVASGSFVSPDSAKLDDGVGATATATGQTLLLHTFGLPATGTITGFRVEVKMRYVGVPVSVAIAPDITVGLSKDSGATVYGTAKTIKAQSNYFVTYDRGGGGGDLWGGASWVVGDVTPATFGVRIVTSFPSGLTPQLEIDVVRVQVFTTAGVTDFVLGQDFPYVTIPIGGGTAVIYPSHGQPPVGSTADTFEGCVVMNDVALPGDVVWSLPGQPEYFPYPYRMRIDPKHRDKITCVRTLGDLVLVWMKRQLWRVHKLPREEDSFFDTTRIKEQVCADRGAVNPNAVCTINPPGQPVIAIFVALNGIHYTNGHAVDTIISAIDWNGMVDVAKLNVCSLVNYPKYSVLAFNYVPLGDAGSTPTKRLLIHYHPSQRDEEGKMKVTGPIDLTSVDQDLAYFGDTAALVSLATNGNVYVEDRGWVDASNGDAHLVMDVLTRDMYPAGVGREATVERVWWRRHRYHEPEITLTVKPWVKKTGGDYTTPTTGQRWTAKLRKALTGIPLVGDIQTINNPGGLERTDQHFLCESFALEAKTSEVANGYALSFFAIEVASKGLSDNG